MASKEAAAKLKGALKMVKGSEPLAFALMGSARLRRPLARVHGDSLPHLHAKCRKTVGLLAQKMQRVGVKKFAGLAAPQLGLDQPVIIATPDGSLYEPSTRVLVNPTYTPLGNGGPTLVSEESCFSLPHLAGRVLRYSRVRVRAFDWLESKLVDEEVEGEVACILQHEIDHVQGILYIDRIGALPGNLWYTIDDEAEADPAPPAKRKNKID